MLGTRIVVKRGGKAEEEKPFWISYADLMTALMILFLVTTAVSLIAVTNNQNKVEQAKASGTRISASFCVESKWSRVRSEKDD